MVKTKQQKSKPKKTPNVKKKGKQANLTQFHAYLDPLGLKIIQLTADGNCFFRGLADQLEGHEEEHGKYRSMVVQYIMKNREMFEPFIEDEIPFDEYCQSMEKDGTWAGNMELQAASLVTHSNICIHRYMSPRWYIQNFKENGARMIHLSYHDEEHYNSVRVKEDPCSGPAWPITIKVDADLSATSHEPKVLSNKSKKGGAHDCVDSGSIKLVMAGSGCENSEKVKQVLLLVDGDVDAAVEFLIAEQQTDDYTAEMETFACDADTSYECQGDSKDGNFEKHKEESPKKKTNEHDLSEIYSNSTSRANDKNIPKNKVSPNKVCSCGSKKKYKNCCGVGKGRSSTKPVGVRAIDSRKSRKETKQGKKGGPAEPGPSMAYDAGLRDMGALCI